MKCIKCGQRYLVILNKCPACNAWRKNKKYKLNKKYQCLMCKFKTKSPFSIRAHVIKHKHKWCMDYFSRYNENGILHMAHKKLRGD